MTIELSKVRQDVYLARLNLDEALEILVEHVADQVGVDLSAKGVTSQTHISASNNFEVRIIVEHSEPEPEPVEPENPEQPEDPAPETPEDLAPETPENPETPEDPAPETPDPDYPEPVSPEDE